MHTDTEHPMITAGRVLLVLAFFAGLAYNLKMWLLIGGL
jgi:hypothetical protein